jgi:hypothetical protein
MALVNIAPVTIFTPIPGGASTVIDATGEFVGIVGYISIEGGPGTSKTISAAGGGKMFTNLAGVTFANAGSTFRIGVQDVDLTTGLGDGTYDVYGDLTGGGGGLTANHVNEIAMSSGTKTLTHGDLVELRFEFNVRAGADSIGCPNSFAKDIFIVNAGNANSGLPYGTVNVGAAAKSASQYPIAIMFDDGTVGWITNSPPFQISRISSTTFSTSSNPDEVGAIFRLPFRCGIIGGTAYLGNIAAADDYEILLYSDPLSVPNVERTWVGDPQLLSSTGADRIVTASWASEFTIEPNTDYILAVRPTTANSITYSFYDFGVSVGADVYKIKRALCFGGDNFRAGSRQNQTGAFIPSADRIMPIFGLTISALDVSSSSGGGGAAVQIFGG